MAKSTGRGAPDEFSRALDRLAEWIDGHRDVLIGLIALRDLGAPADAAVEAVVAVPEILTIKLSYGHCCIDASAGRRRPREGVGPSLESG
jgi:hypothetical protein